MKSHATFSQNGQKEHVTECCIFFIISAYGMTELSPAALCPTVPPKNTATVGAPVSNTFAKIINPDSGEALGPHESGELLIKGPQV